MYIVKLNHKPQVFFLLALIKIIIKSLAIDFRAVSEKLVGKKKIVDPKSIANLSLGLIITFCL